MVTPSKTSSQDDLQENSARKTSRKTSGLSRRAFLRMTARGFGGLALAGGVGAGVGYWETTAYQVIRHEIAMPNLPAAFVGKTIALLSDLHHGPFVSLSYLRRVVAETNALSPDIIALTGDFVYQSERYIVPCFRVLKELRAKLGVFAVLGNHDHRNGPDSIRRAIRACGFYDVDNDGVWLRQGEQRLRVGGVGDYWHDKQDLARALESTHADETALLLSHNPDYAGVLEDSRVGLMLSGHTHGGQIVVPGWGPPFVPSSYGTRFLKGLVRTTSSQVYISRGVGVIGVPFRFQCRPELSLLTLRAKASTSPG